MSLSVRLSDRLYLPVCLSLSLSLPPSPRLSLSSSHPKFIYFQIRKKRTPPPPTHTQTHKKKKPEVTKDGTHFPLSFLSPVLVVVVVVVVVHSLTRLIFGHAPSLFVLYSPLKNS